MRHSHIGEPPNSLTIAVA